MNRFYNNGDDEDENENEDYDFHFNEDDDFDYEDEDIIEGPEYYIINQPRSDAEEKTLAERMLNKAIEVASQDFFWKFRKPEKKAAMIELLYSKFMILASLKE